MPKSRRFNEAPAEYGGRSPAAARRQAGQPRASMRPPLNTGEDLAHVYFINPDTEASMRPPLNTGEDIPAGATGSSAAAGFNEAPAEYGGRCTPPVPVPARLRRFNEAPAEYGGRSRISANGRRS